MKQAKVLHQFQGRTMGTHYRVCLVGRQDIDLAAIQHGIQRAVDAVDKQMSTWKPDSALSRFNQSIPGEWFDVPSELAYVVHEAQQLSVITDGAFDVTQGAAVNLWGFGPQGKCQRLPDTDDIQHNRNKDGYKHLEARLEVPALRKTVDCYVDLSGIAKGFGVDQMAGVLDNMGIRDYLVAIDGEIRVRGAKVPSGDSWTVAVENPVPNKREAYDLLQPRDRSIATSGDYRNFAVLADKHFSHTIDGSTGRPVKNAVGSVTVSQRSCMLADAWATALLVLGPEKGYAVAEKYNIPALFLVRELRGISEVMTPGFEAVIG